MHAFCPALAHTGKRAQPYIDFSMLRAVILSVPFPSSTIAFVCQGYELDKIHHVMYLHYITCGRALYRQLGNSSSPNSVRMTKFFEKILQSCEIKFGFCYLCEMDNIFYFVVGVAIDTKRSRKAAKLLRNL